MSEVNVIAIRMRVGVWHGIDGGMDNKATNSRWEYWENGGEIGDLANPEVGAVSRSAGAIRDEGGRQVAHAWQRPDEEVTVCLTRSQWEFIVADARASLPIYLELAQTAIGQSKREMLESADACRATITLVGLALSAKPEATS